MPSFRNGSLLVNALLVAIGAAAGTGMTVLIGPVMRHEQPASVPGGTVKQVSPATRQALGSGASDSSAQTATENEQGSKTVTEAMQVEELQDRAIAMREAGMDAARKNPADALAMANTIASDQDRLEFLRGVYAVWSRTDPLAALEYAKTSFQPGTARNETIGIAMSKWGSADPRAAWQWADQNLSGPLKDQALTDLMIGWTRRSPSQAAQWLAGTGYTSQPMLNAVAGTWAEQNPSAAASWASSLTNTEARRTAELAAVTGWAEQNPADAAAYVDSRKAGETGPAASAEEAVSLDSVIARIWGASNPQEAAAWISKLGNDAERMEASSTLAMVWASSDIQGAIAWSNTISDANVRRQVTAQIGTTWGAIEPDNALNWLATLPATLAGDGIVGAYNSWAAIDAIGLREWIDSQPAAPAMDQARVSLADAVAGSDITSALALAFGLSSSTARDDAVTRYFHEWRKTDDASAQDWLQQSWKNLAASTQQRLQRELYRPVVAR